MSSRCLWQWNGIISRDSVHSPGKKGLMSLNKDQANSATAALRAPAETNTLAIALDAETNYHH
jgi:hypothetical protein